MVQTTGRNLPPPQSPFVDALLNLSYDGYQYLLSLLAFASTATPVATVSSGLVATGATQATALQLDSQWNVFMTVAAGSGALLQPLEIGQSQTVINGGANPLSVYPPPGISIGSAAVNIPYVLAPGMMQIFQTVSDTQILTTQLQVP